MNKGAKHFVPRVRPDLFGRALRELFVSLNRPLSLEALDLYETKDHAKLLELKVDPRAYVNAEEFRDDYLVVNLLSKANFLSLDLDPEKVARLAVASCEAKCRETNHRFRNLDSSYIGWTASILEGARWKISQVLGDFDCHEWFDCGRWGPGSTATVKVDVSAEEKFRASRGITYPLLTLVGDLLPVAYPSWFQGAMPLEYHKGNKITFVPKNAKTHRPIAVEPDFNLWFQLSIGKMIRRRLKRNAGIDLDTQRNNQSAARLGSITGSLATLDLKSASDTISSEVVRYLISGQDWLACMEACRSHYGTLDGASFKWEKFSSMGNGFTFELETLIFWALAASTCEYLQLDPAVWVFGDDVVIPTEAASKFEEILHFCGFSLNSSKSFSTGKFRESCGVHYFDGLDCQPIYLKSDFLTVEDVYKAHNAIYRLACRRRSDGLADWAFRSVCSLLVLGVSTRSRCGIPEGIGDVGFLTPSSGDTNVDIFVETDLLPLRWGWEGFYVKVWSPRPTRMTVDHRGLLLAKLFRLSFSARVCRLGTDSSEGLGNSYSLRGRTRYRFGKVYVTRWDSPGRFAPGPLLTEVSERAT
jgi:hypothetical protein